MKTSASDEKFIEGRVLNETGDRKIPESAFDTFRKVTFGELLPSSNEANKEYDGKKSGWDEEDGESDSDAEHFNDHKPPPLQVRLPIITEFVLS